MEILPDLPRNSAEEDAGYKRTPATRVAPQALRMQKESPEVQPWRLFT